jgi:tetratricopeptide (TPR) repeat protein
MPYTRAASSLLLGALLVGLVPGVSFGQGQQASSQAYLSFLMGRRLEAEGDNSGALAALKRAAAADPKSAEIQAEIAGFHLRHNERPEAEAAAKAALAINPDNVGANRALGLLNAAAVEGASGRDARAQVQTYLRDAIMYLERAIKASGPTADVTLQYTLGRLYIRNDEPAKAIDSLTKVLVQNPDFFQARLVIAQAYEANKDLKSAIATLQEILPDEPRVASALAHYQEEAGLLNDAVESYTIALAVQPRSRELKIRRIAVLLDAKEYQRAAGFAGEARKQHPDDPRFVRLQARALFDGGDRSGAILLLEQVTKESPKDTDTLFTLADVYADAGRAADAERILRQIVAAEPMNAGALNYLGYLLAVRGEQLDEAIQLVQRALKEEPDNGAYLDSLGWAYFRRGNLDEAEKYLVAAGKQLPENSEVQEHLGDLFARKGRYADAVAAWQRALKGDGQDVDKGAIEKKISNAKGKVQNAK